MTDAPARLDPRQRAFIESARRAVLATLDPHGRPRPVPVCFVLRDEEAGGPVLWTPLDEKPKRVADPMALARVRDIAARPGVSILVDRWDEDWSRLGWVRLLGTARLVEPVADGPEAPVHDAVIRALRARYSQYAGHDLEARPLIRVEIDRLVAWGDLS
jgi:PPOX class probable F420-dependent enzyme